MPLRISHMQVRTPVIERAPNTIIDSFRIRCLSQHITSVVRNTYLKVVVYTFALASISVCPGGGVRRPVSLHLPPSRARTVVFISSFPRSSPSQISREYDSNPNPAFYRTPLQINRQPSGYSQLWLRLNIVVVRLPISKFPTPLPPSPRGGRGSKLPHPVGG